MHPLKGTQEVPQIFLGRSKIGVEVAARQPHACTGLVASTIIGIVFSMQILVDLMPLFFTSFLC